MWIPHVGEQCPFLHLLTNLSDLGGHGVLIHERGGFARCRFQPCTIRERLGLTSRRESIPSTTSSLSSGVFQTFRSSCSCVIHLCHSLVNLSLSVVLSHFLRLLLSSHSIEPVDHSLTIHFFLTLVIATFHSPHQSSHGSRVTTGIRCHRGRTRYRQIHRKRQEQPTSAWSSEAPRA
jgi:hypothetical protein